MSTESGTILPTWNIYKSLMSKTEDSTCLNQGRGCRYGVSNGLNFPVENGAHFHSGHFWMSPQLHDCDSWSFVPAGRTRLQREWVRCLASVDLAWWWSSPVDHARFSSQVEKKRFNQFCFPWHLKGKIAGLVGLSGESRIRVWQGTLWPEAWVEADCRGRLVPNS